MRGKRERVSQNYTEILIEYFFCSSPLLKGKFWLKKRCILQGGASNQLKEKKFLAGAKRKKQTSLSS